MMSQDTKAIRCYLNGRRSGRDRAILARLRADAAHGKAASAITRSALAQYYGLEQRPTPPQDSSQIDALTVQLSTLAESVIGLQQQVTALAGQVALLQQQNATLTALLAATLGDRGTKQQGRELARHALATLAGNGNGANGR